MKWLRKMKIGKRLLMGFIVIAMISAIVGMIGIVNIRNMNALDKKMYEEHTSTLGNLSDVNGAYLRQLLTLRDMYMDKDTADLQGYMEDIADDDKEITESMKTFENSIEDSDVRKQYENLSETLHDFNQYNNEVIAAIKAGKKDKANKLLFGSQGDEMVKAVREDTDKLINLKIKQAKQDSDSNTDTAKQAMIQMVLIILAGITFANVLGIMITDTIRKPIRSVVHCMDQVALGNINLEIPVNSFAKDELSILAVSFVKLLEGIKNQALELERIADGDLTVDVVIRSEEDLVGSKLTELVQKNNDVMSQVVAAAGQVAAGARQLSNASVSLSEGTTEQASAVEELTSSLEEISTQTKHNAKDAAQANELAENARSKAAQGNDQMKEMLKAMEEINESSGSIYKIIKVIDDIAFQTNILALNAAVEAARAGIHGKGFAVVAEEVRNLAARSANAAKETTDMIESSVKKSEFGTKIANDTAESLNEIVEEVEKAAALVSNIAVASNEQAVGIGQINQGIQQVSQVVQENSATSEESAAASQELSSQAQLLKEQVSRFRLMEEKK
jgi:methyl-accepting chemotaxis protein